MSVMLVVADIDDVVPTGSVAVSRTQQELGMAIASMLSGLLPISNLIVI